MTDTTLTSIHRRIQELAEEKERITKRLADISRLEQSYTDVVVDCNLIEIDLNCSPSTATEQNTIEDRLIQIATQNNGTIRSRDVRPVLVYEGMLKGEQRTVSTRLYEALEKSDRFEPAGKRGYWRLIGGDEVVETSDGHVM